MAEPPKSAAPPLEPTRPEVVRQSVAFPQSQRMQDVQPAANEYNKAAQAKQAAIHEAAKNLAPKENAKPEQQRAQEIQKGKDQGR